jgi:hypothetical protein
MNDEYLRTTEFERTIALVRDDIRQGFALTHAKQDTTNGRLGKAERTLEVLNSARLIDRTDALRRDIDALQGAERRRGKVEGYVFNWIGKVTAGIAISIALTALGWWLHVHFMVHVS